ncbi:DUF58 domain-containing protein [Alicyclobacillus mengziensis]|uniref:DUF58 domain-containing protein n=1 Tax=Alicyclobacillus mengziensis TaxID=2931921 RepID=A0A9X7Z8J5_9BACL|nr:DUF58 domain-containing protein [Alicyclobacillus mengziensis]
MFGLHTASKQVPLSGELIVYPRILEFGELPAPLHRWLGELKIRHSVVTDPFLVSGVREYLPGDSIRLIHWKATAHTGDVIRIGISQSSTPNFLWNRSPRVPAGFPGSSRA